MHRSLRETPSSHSILRRRFQSVVSLSTLLVLVACGGGGGGGGGNDPPAPPATNAPPVVNAGADVTITLPTATTTLTGSATDDGPAASLVYTWSGPAGVTFSAGSSATTDATFPAAGPYTLTLAVSDGTQSVSDTVVVTVNGGPSQTVVWPADDLNETDEFRGWAKVDASTVGMTQGGLDTAADFAQDVPAGAEADSGNGMIVRHGQLVHFWGEIDERKPVKSVTKSMGGIVLGLAIDENKLTLASKGVDFIPTFGTPPDTNTALGSATITIGQLATHTAGFEKEGGFVDIIPQGPGTTWSYSDAGLNWLADVLTTVYQEDLRTLAQDRVWSVLGLNLLGGATPDDVFWRTPIKRPLTRTGSTLAHRELASGLDVNVNAMARVGLLFLRKGMWKDNKRVLSEAFVEQVHTPLSANSGLTLSDPAGFPNALTDYGVLWWTNKSKQLANVPEDAYWAWGLGESLIVVIPSLDLVIVRNGGQSPAGVSPNARTWNDDNWDGNPAVLAPFLDPIVAATAP
jgi:CubicO group peptidase (beta-lactamase class C family)